MMVRMFSRRTGWNLAANRFTEAILDARRGGRPVLDLTISNPTHAGIRYEESAILEALRSRGSLDYDPQPKGMLGAREAVAAYYGERGEEVDPENVILTTSTSEGYSFVFRLLADPGDEILVAKPSYPLFEFLADLQDVKLVPYPLIYDHGWQIDFHSLKQALSPRTRAIVCVHPNNPTGSYIGETERTRLNELAAAQEMAVIVDEVFLDYPHDEERRPSFASNGSALTFTLSGLSKISALPQMKLAWIAASGPASQQSEALARLEVIADTFLSVSTPVQLAAPALLAQRKSIQAQLMQRVRDNLRELDCRIAEHSAIARLNVDGGWYAVLRVPATQSDEELAISLLREAGVLVHPGHFYDFPSDGYLILSLICEPQVFREGVSSIVGYLNAL